MSNTLWLSTLQYPTWLSPFVLGPNYPMRWYGMMYLLGFLFAYLFLRWAIKRGSLRIPLDEEGGLYDLMFFIMVGVMVGGRIGNFLLYEPGIFFTKPWEVIGLHFRNGKFSHFGLAGMAFHAGFIGTLLLVLYFVRKYKHDFYNLADHMVISAAPGILFGRMGNFFNAELYGTKTSAWYGMKFPLYNNVGGYSKWIAMSATQRPYTAPRHASMLYEGFLEGFVIFVVLMLLYKMRPKKGTIMWSFVAMYGLFRFSVEFVREPSIAWSLGWFTSGMMYSLPMFFIGLYMIYRRQSSNDDTTPPAAMFEGTTASTTGPVKETTKETASEKKEAPKKAEEKKKPEEKKNPSSSENESKNTSGENSDGGQKKKKKKKKKKK